MSTTPLEEDFDITQDDFSEKAKIIDEWYNIYLRGGNIQKSFEEIFII